MEWERIVQWLWSIFVIVFGFLLKTKNDEIKELSREVGDLKINKIDKEDFKDLQQKVRDDVKGLHEKIETNAAEIRASINSANQESRERLDRILEKMK